MSVPREGIFFTVRKTHPKPKEKQERIERVCPNQVKWSEIVFYLQHNLFIRANSSILFRPGAAQKRGRFVKVVLNSIYKLK
jgi:hypothetical protein